MGIFAIRRVLNAIPKAHILVVAPSSPVGKQWKREIVKCTSPFENVKVITVDKAAKNYKDIPEVDLLVIDEIHQIPTPKRVSCLKIQYRMILGLTATYERLDGKHAIIDRVAPIADSITLAEGIKNGWTSKQKVYVIMCDIEDRNEYNAMTNKFKDLFAWFGYDFDMPFKVLGDSDSRDFFINDKVVPELQLLEGWDDDFVRMNKKRVLSSAYKIAMSNSSSFIRTMTNRKNFIYHHPKKKEIANRILEAKKGQKGITFWSTIEDCMDVKYGKPYASPAQDNDFTEKGNRETLDWFFSTPGAVINTVRALNIGFDCPEITFGIIAGFNSSKTDSMQRRGRVVRINKFFADKSAELYYVVIQGTVDEHWAAKALSDTEYVLLSEDDLDAFLSGKPVDFMEGKLKSGGRY